MFTVILTTGLRLHVHHHLIGYYFTRFSMLRTILPRFTIYAHKNITIFASAQQYIIVTKICDTAIDVHSYINWPAIKYGKVVKYVYNLNV